MKTFLIASAVGLICLGVGFFVGHKIENKNQARAIEANVEAAEALMCSSQMFVDLRAADCIHKNLTNEAIEIIVARIDADMTRLANRHKVAKANGLDKILFETNTIPALNFALSYRKDNLWMNRYGFGVMNTNDPYGIISNSIIRKELEELLKRP